MTGIQIHKIIDAITLSLSLSLSALKWRFNTEDKILFIIIVQEVHD